jgi:hypothetical protein
VIRLRAPIESPTCQQCRHFVDDPLLLERQLPGVLVLSSTYGSTRGDSGICTVFGTLQDPEAACDRFEGRQDEVLPAPPSATSR